MPIFRRVAPPVTTVAPELTVAPKSPDALPPRQLYHHYLVRPHTPTTLQLQPTSYTLSQIRTIYGFPSPSPSAGPLTVGVISFGGGLIGTLTNGVLTNGDVQQQWALLGIQPANQPRVLVVPVNGASTTADPNDGGATLENTIDVATIGAMCPISTLTIILYIANPYDDFPVLLNAAMNPTTVAGHTYTPSIISCSWGTPETSYTVSAISAINAILQIAASRGITVTAASGDNGSSDGTHLTITDFPSSSPYVVACGGTTLRCPTGVYDGSTVETTWSMGGGGFSSVFPKPAYQAALSGTKRATPDIALVADPNTGIQYTFNGSPGVVVGGTSIVSPAIAGFAAALSLKQALTPLLYTYPASTFHDIMTGSNGAYSAKAGFDNCTGLGSIVGSVLAANITGGGPIPIPVTGVTMSGATTVTVGQPAQLTAVITPPTATNQAISFSTSNAGIATVSSSGRVMGVAAGTATITATTADGGFTARTTVTVTSPTVHVTGLRLSIATTTLTVGNQITITPLITPSTANNKAVTWYSSNTTAVPVSSAGIVLAKARGTATITAVSVDRSLRATCIVHVTSR